MTSTPKTIGTSIDIRTIQADPTRVSFAVFNKHATAIIYIKEGSQVSEDSGIPVYPKGSLSMNLLEDGRSVQEPWSFISDTASTNIVIFEGSK